MSRSAAWCSLFCVLLAGPATGQSWILPPTPEVREPELLTEPATVVVEEETRPRHPGEDAEAEEAAAAEAGRDYAAGDGALRVHGLGAGGGIDPETRLPIQGMGCIITTDGMRGDRAYNQELRRLVQQLGPMKGSFLGRVPDAQEALRLVEELGRAVPGTRPDGGIDCPPSDRAPERLVLSALCAPFLPYGVREVPAESLPVKIVVTEDGLLLTLKARGAPEPPTQVDRWVKVLSLETGKTVRSDFHRSPEAVERNNRRKAGLLELIEDSKRSQ